MKYQHCRRVLPLQVKLAPAEHGEPIATLVPVGVAVAAVVVDTTPLEAVPIEQDCVTGSCKQKKNVNKYIIDIVCGSHFTQMSGKTNLLAPAATLYLFPFVSL